MPKFKQRLEERRITKRQLANELKNQNEHFDRMLVEKFIDYECLPTPSTASDLCKILNCDILDLYGVDELDIITNLTRKRRPSIRGIRDNKSHGENVYNLTVEIDRKLAWQLFSKKALKALGYHTRSEMVRDLLNQELAKYLAIEQLDGDTKKTAQGNIVESGPSFPKND